jgi:fatty aldehyde-generating acyl-ACP reductase
MDSTSPGLDFAAIGHQENWQNISAFVNSIRNSGEGNLSCEKIKGIFPFIPPRELFKVKVKSKTGAEIQGAYIESFIDPDKLYTQFTRANINKVMSSISRAKKLGSKIVTLGGFTSIVLEGNMDSFTTEETKFTTGNSLTAAFIVKGLEKAAAQIRMPISESSILVIGATGDIGLACVHYLKSRVNKLLLCARHEQRLEKLAKELYNENVTLAYSVNLQDLLPYADIIIAVTSSIGIQLQNYRKNVLICDAGFPKNLDHHIHDKKDIHLFHGGMGQVTCGYDFSPDYSSTIYKYDAPYIMHGCILEAMVLSFEKKHENYSSAKGNITTEKMEQIYALSVKHGIVLAPFYNAKGLWKTS